MKNKRKTSKRSDDSIKNGAIIDSIMSLLRGYKILNESASNKADKDSLHYLLGQSIRQYAVPKVNRHISSAAYNLWKELSTKSIDEFHYRNMVACDNLKTGKTVQFFKGSEHNGKDFELKPGMRFTFKDLFHEDHVTPISFILKKLIDMNTYDEESVEECLNKMHICVLLKEEDRRIGRTRGRGDFESTIKNAYKDIKLLPIDYK